MNSLGVLVLLVLFPFLAVGEGKILRQFGPTVCPPGSALVGDQPPAGLREGCEMPDGTKVGVWTEWYHSGNPRQRGRFANGKEEGPWVQWHANGEVRIQGKFRNGVLEGEMRSFYTNGILNERGNWSGGAPHGPTEAYFPSGRLAVVGQYLNGEMTGDWWTWQEEGRLVEWVAYGKTGEVGYGILREEAPGGVRYLFGGVKGRLPEGEWWALGLTSGFFQSTPPPIRRAAAPSAPPLLSGRPGE